MNIYAIYKGDEFLFEGTAKECAKYFNVKENTIYSRNTNVYKKRVSAKRKDGKKRNWIEVIFLGKEKDL